MRQSWFSDEQIAGIIQEYEAGVKLSDLCHRRDMSGATFYKWRAKDGGMQASAVSRYGPSVST